MSISNKEKNRLALIREYFEIGLPVTEDLLRVRFRYKKGASFDTSILKLIKDKLPKLLCSIAEKINKFEFSIYVSFETKYGMEIRIKLDLYDKKGKEFIGELVFNKEFLAEEKLLFSFENMKYHKNDFERGYYDLTFSVELDDYSSYVNNIEVNNIFLRITTIPNVIFDGKLYIEKVLKECEFLKFNESVNRNIEDIHNNMMALYEKEARGHIYLSYLIGEDMKWGISYMYSPSYRRIGQYSSVIEFLMRHYGDKHGSTENDVYTIIEDFHDLDIIDLSKTGIKIHEIREHDKEYLFSMFKMMNY